MPKRNETINRMRALAAKQGRNWEKFFKLVNKHYREHHDEPAVAEALEKPSAPEEKEFVADMMRAWNRPWDMWEEQATKRLDLEDRQHKRQAGIVSANETRRRKAKSDYQIYREIAAELIAKNPALRASRNRLAHLVQSELRKRGGKVASARTIWEALDPRK